MIFKILCLTSIILASCLFIKAQQLEWYLKLKKIEVFKTNRRTVEDVFNISAVHNEYVLRFHTIVQYDTPEGDLEVYYSNGLCKENQDSVWDVNKNIVLSLKFNPNEPVNPSKLKIKLKDFETEKSSDTANISYTNEKNGTKLGVLFKKIRYIEFYSTKEQNEMFYCP